MPNWTDNFITFKDEETFERFKRECLDENGNFDFGKVIPQPESPEGLDPKYIRTEESHIEADSNKPWFDWYEWNCDNWGTKWNACDTETSDCSVHFNTAWAAPVPVLEALARKGYLFVCQSEYEGEEEYSVYESLESGKLDREDKTAWGRMMANAVYRGNKEAFASIVNDMVKKTGEDEARDFLDNCIYEFEDQWSEEDERKTETMDFDSFVEYAKGFLCKQCDRMQEELKNDR